METKTVLLLVGAVLVLAVGGYFWWKQEKKNAEKKAREAKANGWTYDRNGGNLDRRYRHLPFVDGDSENAKHVMRGEFRGRPLTLFTYQFQERVYHKGSLFADNDRNNDGKRDSRRVKRLYGVVIVGVPAPLPRFELSSASKAGKRRREERARSAGMLGNMVGEALGDTASDLLLGKGHTGSSVETGDHAFDEAFVVRTTDPDAVRQLLNPQVRAWLLSSEHAKKYVVWVDGQEVITWGTGTDTAIGKVKAGYLNDLLDQLSPAPGGWGPPPA